VLPPTVAAALLRECSAKLASYAALRDVLLIRSVAGNSGDTIKADVFDDIAEAAELIGHSPSWLYRNKGTLPFVLQEGRGCRLRFSRSAWRRSSKSAGCRSWRARGSAGFVRRGGGAGVIS